MTELIQVLTSVNWLPFLAIILTLTPIIWAPAYFMLRERTKTFETLIKSSDGVLKNTQSTLKEERDHRDEIIEKEIEKISKDIEDKTKELCDKLKTSREHFTAAAGEIIKAEWRNVECTLRKIAATHSIAIRDEPFDPADLDGFKPVLQGSVFKELGELHPSENTAIYSPATYARYRQRASDLVKRIEDYEQKRQKPKA